MFNQSTARISSWSKAYPLVTLSAELNRKVPKFSTDDGWFPNDKEAQKPLKELYSACIDSHVFTMSSFANRSPSEPTPSAGLEMLAETNSLQRLTLTLYKTSHWKTTSMRQPQDSRRQGIDMMSC